MTDRIQEIRARCDTATPGPWGTHENHLIKIINTGYNAGFIAHAREDLPWALDEVERLREAQRWRNAETEPPKCEDGAETGPILYRMKTTGTIEVGYYGRKGRWRDSYFRHMRNASDGVDADDVSDWMPLPVAIEKGE